MAAIGNTEKQDSLLKGCAMLIISGLFIAVTFGTCLAELQDQMTFASPAEAVKAMLNGFRTIDKDLNPI